MTNVHVAADARESMRRLEEEDQRRQRSVFSYKNIFCVLVLWEGVGGRV